MLIFPLARNKENGNIESRILIDCALCTKMRVYILPAARKRLMETSFEIGLDDVTSPSLQPPKHLLY